MADTEYGAFIVKVMKTLTDNGFPEKRVSLPLEKMYEAAHKKGLNFNKVLEFLKEKDILHERTAEKFIFYQKGNEPQAQPRTGTAASGLDGLGEIFKNFDPAMFRDMDMSDLLSQASGMMSKLSPEQLRSLQNFYQNMSEEQREEIMRVARDKGLL